MSNKPKYYKLRDPAKYRNQNTQISQFFANQNNTLSDVLCDSRSNEQNADAPPFKKSREDHSHKNENFGPDNLELDLASEKVALPDTSKSRRETTEKARSSIKEFFDHTDSDGDVGGSKRKIARKTTTRKTTVRGRKQSSRAKQTTIKSVLLKNEEVFSELIAQHSVAENIDPFELQLALALSKSEVEMNGQNCTLAEEENYKKFDLVQNTKEKLKQYGFQITNNKRVTDYDIFKAGSKKGKWANKFTPLTLRNPEKQAKKLTEKIANILKSDSPQKCPNSLRENIATTFLAASDILQMFVAKQEMSRTALHQIDSSYIYDYYVIDLFLPSETKMGYLLKDWRKIPGRDLSPPSRKTDNIDFASLSITPENKSSQGLILANERLLLNESSNSFSADRNENKEKNYIEAIPKEEKHSLGPDGNDRLALDSSSSGIGNREMLSVQISPKREKNTAFADPNAESLINEKKHDKICKEESVSDSERLMKDQNKMRNKQRETSPDLFVESDTSLCEVENWDLKKDAPIDSLEKLYEHCTEDEFIVTYEKYSSEEIEVFNKNGHASRTSPTIDFSRKCFLQDCIDLTSRTDSDSDSNEETGGKHNKNKGKFNEADEVNIYETGVLEANLLHDSQKSNQSNNLSQSLPENTSSSEDVCIVLSDDEVNYSIKVTDKALHDLVDSTFSSSSDKDVKNRKEINYNIKMPKNDRNNFSFINLIDEEDKVSPSKSNESLGIDSPLKMSQATRSRNDKSTSARKSLSFSNYNNFTSEYKTNSYSERLSMKSKASEEFVGARLNYDEFDMPNNYREMKLQEKSPIDLFRSSKFHKRLSNFGKYFDNGQSSESVARVKSRPIKTSTAEKNKEDGLASSSRVKRVLSESFTIMRTEIKSPTLKRKSKSQKFNKSISDNLDFSDVDEIDKLVYSPVKKLTPKKPNGMERLLHAELSFTEKNSPRKYITDNKVYLVRTENVSSKPNYKRMSSPTLLKHLYKFGIKPLKRKHAVAILNHIYDQTHPLVVEDGSDSSDDPDTLKISEGPLEDLRIQQTDQKKNNVYEKIYNTFMLTDCDGNKLLDQDGILPEIDEEDYIFPTNVKSKVCTTRLPFHVAWYNLVKSNYELRQALLHYEPIDLQEIYLFLKNLGYRYDPKDMKKFLDKRCIIFRYDLSDGTSNKHVRKNKGVFSQRGF